MGSRNPGIFQGKMDLWDMTHKFFTSNITAQNFRIDEIITLAKEIDIPIVAPRYATAGQVAYLVQDLLDIAREQYEVLEFVTAVSHVKAFEGIGWQLRDRLMNESILCMNGT